MTIERQYGKIIFTCDQENSARCDESLETGTGNWDDAMAAFRKAWWSVFPLRPGPGYAHCCSHCTVPR